MNRSLRLLLGGLGVISAFAGLFVWFWLALLIGQGGHPISFGTFLLGMLGLSLLVIGMALINTMHARSNMTIGVIGLVGGLPFLVLVGSGAFVNAKGHLAYMAAVVGLGLCLVVGGVFLVLRSRAQTKN